MAQVIGSVIVTVATFAVAMAVMYAVNAMGLLRVSRGRRSSTAGSARARHFGLSGVRDLVVRQAFGNFCS